MIVVCNASPIIALAAVGHLDLLRGLYSEIVIPDAVFMKLRQQVRARPVRAK